MKEPYETPVLEIIEIDAEDIIFASGESSNCVIDCEGE